MNISAKTLPAKIVPLDFVDDFADFFFFCLARMKCFGCN